MRSCLGGPAEKHLLLLALDRCARLHAMGILGRLFGNKRSEKLRSASASRDAPTTTDDAVIAAREQLLGPQDAGWASDRGQPPDTGPQYIAEAAQPTEGDWAREEELYRQKNEDRSDPQSHEE